MMITFAAMMTPRVTFINEYKMRPEEGEFSNNSVLYAFLRNVETSKTQFVVLKGLKRKSLDTAATMLTHSGPSVKLDMDR